MTFSWDFNTATLLGIVTQAVLLIIFLVRTDSRVKSATEIAREAKTLAASAHDKIAIASEAHALFREHVVGHYIDHEALQAMENRLAGSIKEIRDRLDKVLDNRLGK